MEGLSCKRCASDQLRAFNGELGIHSWAVSQTSDELRAKYGSPLQEQFMLQPKIALAVTHSACASKNRSASSAAMQPVPAAVIA
jgi:hypothetical protein